MASYAKLFCVFLLLAVTVQCRRDDDEPYDPYTTTDPAKREPSPCEGLLCHSCFTLLCALVEVLFAKCPPNVHFTINRQETTVACSDVTLT